VDSKPDCVRANRERRLQAALAECSQVQFLGRAIAHSRLDLNQAVALKLLSGNQGEN
jgi:hypothetical protein